MMTALTSPDLSVDSDQLTPSSSSEVSSEENEGDSSSKRVHPARRPLSLTGAARRALRAQGHHLKPVVQIGQAGLSEGVIEATKVALDQHELIKVSINGESPTERKSGAEQLAEATGAHVAQVIGRVIMLYRERERKEGTKVVTAQSTNAKSKAQQGKTKRTSKKSPKKGKR